jgi:aspartyl protease family protein
MRVSSGTSNFAREAVGWLFIGSIVFAGVYFFTDLRAATRVVAEHYAASSGDGSQGDDARTKVQSNATSGEVHIQAGEGGHFFSDVEVNGRTITAVVDTGATGVALSYEDARAIGIRLDEADFTMESQTANGSAKIAPITLERVQIGDIEVRDVQAFVAEKGKLFQTLLGMSFLRRLSRIDIRGGELVLVQ